MIVLVTVFLLVLFLFLGMPVAFSLGLSGVIGLLLAGGPDAVYSVLFTVPYRTAANYTLTTVPMFILMAQLVSVSGIVSEVFTAARLWLERLPGGLAIASVLASAGMGAMSGSSTASAAAMASITVPEMIKHGYNASVAAGVISVAGTLAIMIPPSIGLVLYGIITENSIGKLLIAGIIPGLMTATTYCLGIITWNRLKPGIMPATTNRYTWGQRFIALRPLWAFIILALLVIGSMYLGWATPTESAAIGAFGALTLSLFRRRLGWKEFQQAVVRTIEITAMIFMIIIGAMIFGYFLTLTQTTQKMIVVIAGLHFPPWLVLGLILVLLISLGCMLDQLAIMLITLPLIYPLVINLGYDPIWFGVICMKVGEIGLVTPPVGMNAYVVSASTGVPLDQVFRGIGFMLIFEIISLALLLAFPGLTTWLPSMM
jgi:tripartite ATP-independent transporter DctM subunit